MDPDLYLFLLSLISANQTNRANMQNMQQQQQWSEEMMQQQNEYNTPSAQVQRLREAGISPLALSMGKGLDIQGNISAQPLPYAQAQLVDPFSVASNSLLSMSKANETNSLLEARLQNIIEQTNNYKEQSKLLQLDQREQSIINDYCALMQEAALLESYSEIDLNYQQISYLKQQEEKLKYEILNVLPAQVQEAISRANLNVLEQDKVVALIQQIYAETDLTREMTNTEEIRQAQAIQDIANTQASTEYTQALTDDVKNTIRLFLDTYDDQVRNVAAGADLQVKQAQLYYLKQIAGLGIGLGAAAIPAGKAIGGAIKAGKGFKSAANISTTW